MTSVVVKSTKQKHIKSNQMLLLFASGAVIVKTQTTVSSVSDKVKNRLEQLDEFEEVKKINYVCMLLELYRALHGAWWLRILCALHTSSPSL